MSWNIIIYYSNLIEVKDSEFMKFMKKSLIMMGVLFAVILTLGAIHAADAANTTTFSDLSDEISDTQTSNVVELSSNYQFNERADRGYVDGVTVSKDMTIKGNKKVIDGNGKARALYVTSGTNLVVESVTFKNCYSESGGAAIYLCKNSNLILKDCIFTNNKVYNSNGGAINSHSTTSINAYNCVFKYNTAIRESNLEWNKFKKGMGSVFCIGINSKLNLHDCTVSNNKGYLSTVVVISNSDEGHKASKLYANNCLFENNVARTHTVIYIDELGKCEVTGSTFRNNRATTACSIIDLDGTISSVFKDCLFESNSGVKGGVFYIFPHGKTKSTVSISGSTFNKNTASEIGGAIYANSARLTLTNNKFNLNTAKDRGGAIMIHKGSVKLTNCVFNKNKASKGGAAVFACYNVVMTKSKFTGNKATKFGGAIYQKVNKHSVSKCTYKSNKAPKSKNVFDKYKVYVKQTSKKRSNLRFDIKVHSSWSAPLNQKIILKLKGPKFFKSNWIKMPTNGKISFKVPVKLKKGTYKVSVFMDGETCKYNHPKVKVV